MPLERSGKPANGADSAAELEKLRSLLVGPEQNRIEELAEEVRSRDLSARHLAEQLPEAIALSGSRGDQLGRALSPTIDTALRESIRRDPREIATAIFPVLGPAIRKAIAEAMSGLVTSINSAVEQSLSLRGLKWRVESMRSGVPYPEVVLKHALVYRVEQAFLVHAETGLLLEHVSAPNLVVGEADLIGNMMSAIQDFVHDSFRPGEDARLRTFSVGDHTVQVEAGPRALLAIVIRGQAPEELLRKQQDTLETVHLEFASQLADFAGDPAPFEPAKPLLEDCLETVLSTDKPRDRQGKAWLKWGIPLLLLMLALAALFVRSSIRFRRGLEALRAEPGIVVVDASRGMGGWTVSGLKDPLAREPAAVLGAVGVKPGSLSGDWESYISLDPAMSAARARHAVDSIGALVQRERVLFAAGSSALDPIAIMRLTRVAGYIAQLDPLAASLGSTVGVSLTGRTDFTGANETNSVLAQNRIASVTDFLVSSGVARERLIPDPVATEKPLLGQDEADRARINRSVSFTVALRGASSGSGGKR
jgi:OOP family OmpA-OmpF porin